MLRHLQSNDPADRRLSWTASGRSAQRIVCGVLALLALSALLALGNTQPTNAPPPAEAPLPKSVFVDDPRQGKDPFFPKSTRRAPAQAPVQVDGPAEAVDGVFTLQGLSFVGGRKLALINKRTLAEGEEMDVKIKSGIARLKCVEIRERSVVISIRGVTQEISLRPGL